MCVLGQPRQHVAHDCRADTLSLPRRPDADVDDFEENGTVTNHTCKADCVLRIYGTNRIEASCQAFRDQINVGEDQTRRSADINIFFNGWCASFECNRHKFISNEPQEFHQLIPGFRRLVQFSQLGTARLHLAQLRNLKRVREHGTATGIEVRDLLPLFKDFNADLIRLLLPQLAPIDRVLAENEVALGEAAST
jgi:hypothetical protein